VWPLVLSLGSVTVHIDAAGTSAKTPGSGYALGLIGRLTGSVALAVAGG
jgi:hypothetical protein